MAETDIFLKIQGLLQKLNMVDKLKVKVLVDDNIYQERYRAKMGKDNSSNAKKAAGDASENDKDKTDFWKETKKLAVDLGLESRSLEYLKNAPEKASPIQEHLPPLIILDMLESAVRGNAYGKERTKKAVTLAITAAKAMAADNLDVVSATLSVIGNLDDSSTPGLGVLKQALAGKKKAAMEMLEMIKEMEETGSGLADNAESSDRTGKTENPENPGKQNSANG
ncbi:hypothetical protein BDV95DRAFT_594211 [Massariosphaeria phaeospora]|uniref:Uncharacterized protein n=1 Tax=Massariosphaeria phaeospora TaxID=100035 RepID=A0A7C8MPG7_9PLEO|nr:hypothetical protein BDV95DRAFT_594211 [Massariosphaeria phaeospora]